MVADNTNDVLALVSLIWVSHHSFNDSILALDLVLVAALLLEASPLLVVIGTSSTCFGPSSLVLLVLFINNESNGRTSFPFIITSMTSPEAYSSLVKPEAAAKGNTTLATDAHFIANKTAG